MCIIILHSSWGGVANLRAAFGTKNTSDTTVMPFTKRTGKKSCYWQGEVLKMYLGLKIKPEYVKIVRKIELAKDIPIKSDFILKK